MALNSRSLSFLIALLVGVSTSLLLSLVPTIGTNEITLGFIGAFFTSFITCFLVLEFVVFKELRKAFILVEQLRGVTISRNSSALSIKKIGSELFNYTNKKEQEIEKLKRLETIRKEFLADISHELKTPIFSAQGFISTLQDGAIDDENVRDRFLGKAAKSLDELDRLVHDLLSISQLETGEFILKWEAFDAEKLTKEIFEQLEVTAKLKKISLKTAKKESEQPIVIADRQRIEHALKNLIVNAINYGYENGEVIVNFKSLKDNLELTVTDSGPGIPLEHQANIFRRFYRIDKSRSKEMGGTGLGLSIVKHIVEVHNSKIVVSSKIGKGTSFSFKLKKGYDDKNEV